MSKKKKARKKFIEQLTFRCSQCNQQKSKKEFSASQLRKPVKSRKCKICVTKNEEKVKQYRETKAQAAQNTKPINIPREYKKNPYIKVEHTGSNSLTELEKLHNHCYGMTVFSEIRLSLQVRVLFIDSSMKREIQNALKRWPEAFICHNRVIVASDCLKDPMSQYKIYKQIWNKYSTFIDSNASKPCYLKLGYEKGEISNDGVTLYDSEKTLKTENVQYLFNNSPAFNAQMDASEPIPRTYAPSEDSKENETKNESKKKSSKKNKKKNSNELNAKENKTRNETRKTKEFENNSKKNRNRKKNVSKEMNPEENSTNNEFDNNSKKNKKRKKRSRKNY